MINIRLALRALFRSPFLTSVAIVSLALGIGANAAIYSLFDQLLRRPMPVTAPEMLVNLSAPGPKPGSTSCSNAGSCEDVFSYQMFKDLQKASTPFVGIAAHRVFGANLAYKGQTATRRRHARQRLVFPAARPAPRARPAARRRTTTSRSASRTWWCCRTPTGRRALA